MPGLGPVGFCLGRGSSAEGMGQGSPFALGVVGIGESPALHREGLSIASPESSPHPSRAGHGCVYMGL